jgi:predicted N-acetyltransferase YhbS
MQIRPARADDHDGVEAMVARRVEWMSDNGLPSRPEIAQAMAEQAAEADTPMWVLVDDGQVVGCTSTYTESPEWGFTEQERAIPALFLASTWTWPTDQRLGWVLARWALDHAARTGREVVRRGTFAPGLVRYYTQVQGWAVVREVERKRKVCTFLSRPAELRTDLVLDTPVS